MYQTFYHLHSNPFRITPDPKFCFSHSGYQTARQYLDYALRLGEGFIMVTGRPGTGKTTLAETFLKDVDLGRVSASRIAASGLEGHDMLRAVAYACGIDANSLDKATLRRRIQQHLLQHKQAGRRALLIIDEAQGLPPSSLEELRLLADLQEQSQPLLQLFLVGQEPLRELMCTPQMEQFQQRIIATCHLKPLGLRETRAYIKYRLRLAGWQGDPELSGAALLAIHAWSAGVPRQINKICNRMLLLGYGKGKHVLDEADARTIAAELRTEQLTYQGDSQDSANEPGSTPPLAKSGNGTFSLAELAVRWDDDDVKNPVKTVAAAPASPPEVTAATRQAQQTSAWRMEAKVRSRREKLQQGKASTPRANRIPAAATPPRRNKPALVRSSAGRNWPRTAMTLAVTAFAAVGLLVVGSARFQLEERIGPKNSLREHRALKSPSVPGPYKRQQNTADGNPQAGKGKLKPRQLAASPEDRPGDGSRAPGSGDTVLADASLAPEAGTIADMATAGAAPPPVPSATSTALIPDAPHDRSETASPGTGDEDTAVTASNREPADLEFTDPPAAGDRAGTTAYASAPPVFSPVSLDATMAASNPESADFEMLAATVAADRAGKAAPTSAGPAEPPRSPDEKIATLLALGRQSLQQFRLLTPEGNNAHHYFRQVLELDPGNADAREGLDRIVDRYVALVKRANARQKTGLARLYISRGLRVEPGNGDLLALQDDLRKPPVIPVATIAAAETDVVSEPRQPASLFSRLKSLFTWRRAQPADVVERSIPFAEP